MSSSLAIRLTRMRMYALIDAFERDMRDVLRRYVLEEVSTEEALCHFLAGAHDKQARDNTGDSESSLIEYLDFKQAYDLLNIHRALLPEALAREVRELTASTDRLVQVRNRVMHGRPLVPGDPDALVSVLRLFAAKQWRALHEIWRVLEADPFWEPVGEPNPMDFGLALHNLPLPDYDDTGLIGREADISRVIEMCKKKRENVITITGEGGIGKTALALEVAYRLVDDNDRPFDVVLWCSLKTERLTAEGVRRISQAVTSLTGAAEFLASVVDSSGLRTYEQLADLLSGLKTLLVIDNLETVNSTSFVDLYEAMPADVRFLLTSRVGVGEIERRYPLAQLNEKDATRLLADFSNRRFVATLKRIAPTTRVEIVKRLRCSPLAIRWFVLAVESGREPLNLIRNQGELLDFCVRSVYDALSDEARPILQALFALARPATSDELVLLTEKQVDEISRAVKELTRGSLVVVEAKRDLGATFSISISESASQFLRHGDLADEIYVSEIAKRDEEFRAHEERRAIEEAERSLAPAVVRTRDRSDAATAQLLRRAMLASLADDLETAESLVNRARGLNHDYWEVDRVEAFLLLRRQQYTGATTLFLRAYKLADGEHKAVAAHFLAGHLSRNVRDLESATRYAREAHATIQTVDTAVALGNQLIWAHSFKEGIALLEPCVAKAKGKSRLIAATSLVEARRRHGEHIRDNERKPLAAFEEAWSGFEAAVPLMAEGVIDRKLVASAADAAAGALHCLGSAIENGIPLPSNYEGRIGAIIPHLPRLLRSSKGNGLRVAIEKAGRWGASCPSFVGLLSEMLAIEVAHKEADDDSSGFLVGYIHSVPGSSFGFISHDDYPENVYFHKRDFTANRPMSSLVRGSQVRFQVESQPDGKHRAFRVTPID